LSSKRFTFTHTTGCATWVTLVVTRVTATQFWCQSVISSVIQSGFILQSFIFHSYFTFSARFLSSLNLNSPSELPIIKAYHYLFNFDGGENRSARRKPPVRDPRRKSLFYGATSSAASWDGTHTPHRHWLQVCKSDTSDAPWTTRPPRIAAYSTVLFLSTLGCLSWLFVFLNFKAIVRLLLLKSAHVIVDC
jgi:hypothetical protein